MDTTLIYEGKVTLEEMWMLNGLGYEFVIEHGVITNMFRD